MINPVDRLSWQEMLGHPASEGHLVDTQVNTAYNKMAVLSDHIDEFKDLYDFVFRIKGWLKYYLQAYYGLKDISESGLNNDTNGIGGDIDLINPITGDIETNKVWRIYIKNYDEMIKASENGLPIPTPIVRFANIYDPSNPSYLDLSYDDNGNPTFSGTFNTKDPNSFIPLWYLKNISVDRSIFTTTDSHGRANKRLVVNDVVNFSDGFHINVSGAADVPFVATGGTVNITGDATGTGTVDANGNVVVPTAVSHAAHADRATNADSAARATNADSATNAGHATNADHATKADSATKASTADKASEADHAADSDHADEADHAKVADKLAGGAGGALGGLQWYDAHVSLDSTTGVSTVRIAYYSCGNGLYYFCCADELSFLPVAGIDYIYISLPDGFKHPYVKLNNGKPEIAYSKSVYIMGFPGSSGQGDPGLAHFRGFNEILACEVDNA